MIISYLDVRCYGNWGWFVSSLTAYSKPAEGSLSLEWHSSPLLFWEPVCLNSASSCQCVWSTVSVCLIFNLFTRANFVILSSCSDLPGVGISKITSTVYFLFHILGMKFFTRNVLHIINEVVYSKCITYYLCKLIFW